MILTIASWCLITFLISTSNNPLLNMWFVIVSGIIIVLSLLTGGQDGKRNE